MCCRSQVLQSQRCVESTCWGGPLNWGPLTCEGDSSPVLYEREMPTCPQSVYVAASNFSRISESADPRTWRKALPSSVLQTGLQGGD